MLAYALGGRVREVTLETDLDEASGLTSIDWTALAPHARVAASACCALGGPLAELAFEGRAAELTLERLASWRADWNEVERALDVLEVRGEERETTLRAWIADAKRCFADVHFVERVARVADALAAHGTLDETLFEDACA